ncbi:hypothetical protein [uncultured Dysosmobacter sp.]|nr:hypothetical protein [uncultured Dysosmobacter sp.]
MSFNVTASGLQGRCLLWHQTKRFQVRFKTFTGRTARTIHKTDHCKETLI